MLVALQDGDDDETPQKMNFCRTPLVLVYRLHKNKMTYGIYN